MSLLNTLESSTVPQSLVESRSSHALASVETSVTQHHLAMASLPSSLTVQLLTSPTPAELAKLQLMISVQDRAEPFSKPAIYSSA
jgi:hypothetical protein